MFHIRKGHNLVTGINLNIMAQTCSQQIWKSNKLMKIVFLKKIGFERQFVFKSIRKLDGF